MRNLKSSLLLLLFVPLVSACQSTGAYHLETVHAQGGDLHVIRTSSDRVQQKCLFLDAEEENNWRHQYFMYVLSDKNEALEIMQSTHLDGDYCRAQVRAIERLLGAESQAKICVRDELKRSQDAETQNETISFGPLGQYKVTHEGPTFDSICNSQKCVGDNSAWVDTCPGFPKH